MKTSIFKADGTIDETIFPLAVSARDKSMIGRLNRDERDILTLALLGQITSNGLVRNIKVTPVLDTLIYAAGDVLFDSTIITGAARNSAGSTRLVSLALLDKDDNAAAGIDLFFLSSNVSLGTFNVAPAITDVNAEAIQGFVSLVAGDFIDVGGAKVASKSGLNMVLTPDTGNDLWVAAIARGTPTQTASGIVLNFGFVQE